MRSRSSIPSVLVSVCLVLLGAAPALAQVPTRISYQGRITAHGTNFNGTGYFKFALVNGAGTARYWSNDGTGLFPAPFEPNTAVPVDVDDGLFMVFLGDGSLPNMQDMDNAVFENFDAHLRIWFSEDNTTFTALSPDQPFGSVGYAVMAERVVPSAIGESQLGQNAVTVFKIANGAVSGQKLALNSVTDEKIVNGTITSNKIDWSTMPPRNPRSYADHGAFAAAPTASGDDSVAIGLGAVASGEWSVVGGGYYNIAGSGRATVAGGLYNEAHGFSSAIGGGGENRAGGDYTTVAGGQANAASNQHATVGGGYMNRALADYATVGGGQHNVAHGTNSFVGGGQANIARYQWSVVVGGSNNVADGATAFIGGGRGNRVTNSFGGAVIVGGWTNEASGPWSTVGGGYFNRALAETAVVGGGQSNRAAAIRTTIPGGWANRAEAQYATVGGGERNFALTNSRYAVIGGGRFNVISTGDVFGVGWTGASYSVIGGGFSNLIKGPYATIPGGMENFAADYSFAAGRRAKALHEGSFVWGDVVDADVASTTSNQVTFRASGGYRLFSSSSLSAGVSLAAGAGSWTSISDRNLKEEFEPVDPRAILDKVADLPMATWKYKSQDASIRHIGPMAQDFHAAFGVGETELGITAIDADGVALAAIQGLYSRVQALQAENEELKTRLERLEAVQRNTRH